jgi:acetyl-CoA carboxylase biotin carboxyl carrier protein
MELKDIQQLIKYVSNSKVDMVELEKENFKIKIKKNETKTEVINVAPQGSIPQSIPQVPVATPQAATPQVEAPAVEKPADAAAPTNTVGGKITYDWYVLQISLP